MSYNDDSKSRWLALQTLEAYYAIDQWSSRICCCSPVYV